MATPVPLPSPASRKGWGNSRLVNKHGGNGRYRDRFGGSEQGNVASVILLFIYMYIIYTRVCISLNAGFIYNPIYTHTDHIPLNVSEEKLWDHVARTPTLIYDCKPL